VYIVGGLVAVGRGGTEPLIRMMRMRMILCVLCVTMCSGTASTQEHVSNFDACVNASKLRHTDSVMENYLSYKCDGAIAERLAARPDQCSLDLKPSLHRIVRKSRQLDEGLYVRMIWSTEVCAGMCETMIYRDARETSYLCEVRRHTAGRMTLDGGQGYPRYVDEYLPRQGWIYPARGYGRWVYREPGWHLEYEYPPSGYREVYRHDD
jgi:hypothetical protein